LAIPHGQIIGRKIGDVAEPPVDRAAGQRDQDKEFAKTIARSVGMMESWNTGVMSIRPNPVIPSFHYSNIPSLHFPLLFKPAEHLLGVLLKDFPLVLGR
jgi:hypothetical protein